MQTFDREEIKKILFENREVSQKEQDAAHDWLKQLFKENSVKTLESIFRDLFQRYLAQYSTKEEWDNIKKIHSFENTLNCLKNYVEKNCQT